VRIDYPADWKVEGETPTDKTMALQIRFAGPSGAQFTLAARLAPDQDRSLPTEARRQAAHKRGRLTLTGQEKNYAEGKPEAVFVSGNPGRQSTLKFRREGADWKGLRVTVPLQRHHFLCEALTPATNANKVRPIFDEMIRSLVLGD
jgi:hypothetical protein